MIHDVTGDLLNASAEALVNPVNCVGVMGKGLALQFKERFPDNFRFYRQACTAGNVRPGAMLVFDCAAETGPRYIINFPTKRHWRDSSKIADIASGLTALASEVQSRQIKSIALPPLGCGLGGLDWTEVRPMIVAALSPVTDLEVYIYGK